MTDMRAIDIDLQPEICCDYCGEVVHTHIHCPCCKDAFAPTDLYGSSALAEEIGFKLSCEKCGAVFELVSKETDNAEPLWRVTHQRSGRFRPKDMSTLRPGLRKFVGGIFKFDPAGVGSDDEPYPGQAQWTFSREHDLKLTEFAGMWVPEEDIQWGAGA